MSAPRSSDFARFASAPRAPEVKYRSRAPTAEAQAALAQLNGPAHAATKLRARADALSRLRGAIESELTVAGLNAGMASP